MSYLEAVGGDLAIKSPELRNLVATHIHDLVAMIVGATHDGIAIAEERGVAAARLAAVKADIIEHIGCEDIDLLAVAARQGMTPRSIQRFEREGSTFSAFKLERQLTRAQHMLQSKQYAAWTIAAIALAAGFGDVSYFHRIVRRRFGVIPSDLRAAGR
jgi:AraC-like DNA-binding protein